MAPAISVQTVAELGFASSSVPARDRRLGRKDQVRPTEDQVASACCERDTEVLQCRIEIRIANGAEELRSHRTQGVSLGGRSNGSGYGDLQIIATDAFFPNALDIVALATVEVD